MDKTVTEALVQKLQEMGYSKWRIMRSLDPEPSYRTIDAWSRGEWNASKKVYLPQLQDLYSNRCRELGVGLFEERKDST